MSSGHIAVMAGVLQSHLRALRQLARCITAQLKSERKRTIVRPTRAWPLGQSLAVETAFLCPELLRPVRLVIDLSNVWKGLEVLRNPRRGRRHRGALPVL